MCESLDEAKRRLRRAMRTRPAESPGERATAARRAVRRLLALPEYRGARVVALYAALPDELPSRGLYEAARRSGRTLLLPRVTAAGLQFAPVAAWDDLSPGAFGVLEPQVGGEVEPELVIVPGVAFDAAGRRLGRGGGHYDRGLAGMPGATRLGLAFESRVVDAVPAAETDARMDLLVTESRVRRFGVRGRA